MAFVVGAVASYSVALELDHIFCMVDDSAGAARQLARAGWLLDAGIVHRGQGTRNRRLAWPEQYFELLWVCDGVEARANPMRLDRRANWRRTGASPFGFALRGQLPKASLGDYWLYEALGPRIWVHRDNEQAPERPLSFVLEATDDEFERRRPRSRAPDLLRHKHPGALREVRVRGPAPLVLPQYEGPTITYAEGPHHLELVVGEGAPRPITDILAIRG